MRTILITLLCYIFSYPVISQNVYVQEMVNSTNRDSLLSNVLKLQSFGTRYEYTANRDSAASWILKEFKRWGLQAEYDEYIIGKCTFFDADLVNNDSLWAVGDNNTILFSSNGGLNWTVQTSPTPANSVFYGMDFITSQNGVAVGNSGIIIQTSDGGSTWNSVSSPTGNYLFAVGFANDSTVIITGDKGTILRSSTGGTSWSIINSGTAVKFIDITFISSTDAVVVGDSGYVLKTTDGGLTWQKKQTGVTSVLYSVYFLDSLHGFACGNGSTIIQTKDGGETWSQIPFPNLTSGALRGIFFPDSQNGFLVELSAKTFKTTDGGLSWQITESLLDSNWGSAFYDLKVFPNERLVIVGGNSLIFSSTNKGEIWTNLQNTLPPQYLHSSRNIVASIPGTETPEKECVMVAHYDSYNRNSITLSPGADDNATGTAAVMEAARIMRKYKFRSTVKLLAVSGEELGLYGSYHYAYTAKKQGRNIIGAINGDMLGNPLNGDSLHLYVGTYLNRNKLLDSVGIYNQRYQIGLNLDQALDSSGASDHRPFTMAGYDAILFIEASVKEIGAGHNPFIHTINDSVGKLNFGLVHHASQLMIATVAELAEANGKATSVNKIVNELPLAPELYQNYPNPFKTSTTISFSLPSKLFVKLKIVDLCGRTISTIVSEELSSGKYSYNWSAVNLKSGIYYLHLQAGSYCGTKKLILLRTGNSIK